MISSLLTSLASFVSAAISTLGYPGIAVLMALESAATPLPSELIMPFAGYLVSTGRFSLFGVSLAGALGSTLGSIIVYMIARYGGRPLVEKYGKRIFISPAHLEAAEIFFKTHGVSALFLGRIIPVVRTYISIPAGIAQAPLGIFTLTCFVGSFLWSLLLAWVGQIFGNGWHIITPYAQIINYCIGIALFFLVAYWFLKRVLSRRDNKRDRED